MHVGIYHVGLSFGCHSPIRNHDHACIMTMVACGRPDCDCMHAWLSARLQVDRLKLFHDNRTGQSRGSGLVTMQTRDQAQAAADELNEWHMLPVSCMRMHGWRACMLGIRQSPLAGVDTPFSLSLSFSVACVLAHRHAAMPVAHEMCSLLTPPHRLCLRACTARALTSR